MSPFDPTIDTSFLEYADLQLRRHRALGIGFRIERRQGVFRLELHGRRALA